MKRLIKLFLLLIFCMFLNLNANEKITISNGEWPPFFSQELKNYGITSHIVSKAFKMENIKVQYKWYPWKRAFHLAKNGDIEATVGWEKTKKREKYFLFSEPILIGDVVFFHLKDLNFSWNEIDKLNNFKIGTVTGYDYKGSLEKLKKNKNVKIYDVINEKKLFELLLNKRFDLVIINKNVGYGILKKFFEKNSINNITHHKKPFSQEKLRLLFNKDIKKNYEYLQRFNKGLKKIKVSGEFDRLYKQAIN